MFRLPAPLRQARTIAIVDASDRARWPVSIHKIVCDKGKGVRAVDIRPIMRSSIG
ncbi:MAG: hypothetical protein O7G83_10110 [Proteobacteria bacterium]|nr:hypothetical protein [Pseudomonadota bacterium]